MSNSSTDSWDKIDRVALVNGLLCQARADGSIPINSKVLAEKASLALVAGINGVLQENGRLRIEAEQKDAALLACENTLVAARLALLQAKSDKLDVRICDTIRAARIALNPEEVDTP